MKLDEICSGCSRHVAVCVCGVSIGPEGAVHYRPNPTNLAGKLKIVANNAKLEMIKIKTQRLVDQILWRATQAATRGDYSINIWLSDLGITKETAERNLSKGNTMFTKWFHSVLGMSAIAFILGMIELIGQITLCILNPKYSMNISNWWWAFTNGFITLIMLALFGVLIYFFYGLAGLLGLGLIEWWQETKKERS